MGEIVQIVTTPGSGDGRAQATARRLRKALLRRGHEAHIRTFTDFQRLQEWADSCEPEFSRLVGIGGDATISAVAAAAVRLSVPFVPVPNGFGNLFARAFGFGDQTKRVIKLFEKGRIRRVDVGRLPDGRLFLSHRSFGLLNEIQEAVEQSREQPRSRLLRHFAYYAQARQFLYRAPLESIRVEVDGAVVAEAAALVTVANVETYRGYLSLTPAASPIDGLFDVFAVSARSRLRLWMRVLALFLGGSRKADGVTFERGQRVRVTVMGQPPEELSVCRGALPLLVLPQSVAELQARQGEAETRLAQE